MKSPINYYYLVLTILVNLLLTSICSESGAAISALAHTITELVLVWKGMQVLEELTGSHKIPLVWMTAHHAILGNEGDKFVEEGTNKVPSDQTVGIPSVVREGHLRHKHLNRWEACKVCRQSKMLRREYQLSRAKELQAMNRPKIKGTVGLLTGHTTLRAHMFELELTQHRGQKGKVHFVCHCAALACKGTEPWVIRSRSQRI